MGVGDRNTTSGGSKGYLSVNFILNLRRQYSTEPGEQQMKGLRLQQACQAQLCDVHTLDA
jgi:hypothetical protein